MCVTLSSSREVNDPDKDVGEVVASCDLYLMDTTVPDLLLPNKRYRTIDPKLKNILGSSDVEAKLSTKFRYAYVEVLPLAGKKYIDDAITLPATKLAGQKLGYVIEVNKNLLMTMPTSINTSAPLPIPNGINRDYMDWLRDEQKQDPWPEYNKATTSPYEYSIARIKAYGINVESSQIKNVEMSGSSSVPINATLIDVNDLMSNFKAGANKTDYTYSNFLEKSPLTTDQDISDTFMHHINNGHLPSQYYYVLGHGNTFAFSGYDNQTGAAVYYDSQIGSLTQLFVKLKINGYTFDKTLIFLSCHLGNGVGSFAELFSALPDVGTVYAFTGFGWVGSRRPFYCGPGYLVSYEESAVKGIKGTSVVGAIKKQLYSSIDLKGHWRIFNAATAVIKS